MKKTKAIVDEYKIVDNIRSLGIDMINEAKSGHPGIVLGAAPILYTLYGRHLNINPKEPNWINRDRFVLSAGHGSALLYATLFMAGYDINIDDLKSFRKINSKTPGHPEYNITPGVESSTGPLGQGLANAVGMAIAERFLASKYNTKKNLVIDYNTYVLCSDGDLMEGISYEAISLAGHLKLNKLIVLYDSNDICLDGSTKITFSENVIDRFKALEWNTILVKNGNNINEISKAIEKAKNSNKPTLIEIKTIIGKYSKYQGTNKVHGSPLEEEDIINIKKTLNIRNVPFSVSNEAINEFQKAIIMRYEDCHKKWMNTFNLLDKNLQQELVQIINKKPNFNLKELEFDIPDKAIESTRVTGGKILNAISKLLPFLIGGSADLSNSTKTRLLEETDFQANNYSGRNINFGVREHSMGAILNGLALSGLRPFGSTFLAFADYLKPALRMSSIMNLPVIYIFTHDSISVGEDGPTHQPVEQLTMLRSIPNLDVFRPADANEVIGTYKAIITKKEGPSAIILSRNDVPIIENTKVKEVKNGAYIVKNEASKLNAIIITTGEELSLALNIADNLTAKGYGIRVVSMPSIELYEEKNDEYKELILPTTIKKFVIEKSTSHSWYKYVYNDNYLFNINNFGIS
ncbi:MAG: transketolase, partial [Tenericutes bacterium]|nr:transketolase [Mycoplasmatota bacterium]